MATRLITNDAQLRRYMPNVFATAQGETPLFDKVLPWLETAERWLFQQFIGNTFEPSLLAMGENEPVRLTATCVVAHEAMLRAVPSLDLVLTPNGFGIVSNQNVAPASRERVSRLIASLETSRDNAIEQLIMYLFRETPTSAASPNIGGRTIWACAPMRLPLKRKSPMTMCRPNNSPCFATRCSAWTLSSRFKLRNTLRYCSSCAPSS